MGSYSMGLAGIVLSFMLVSYGAAVAQDDAAGGSAAADEDLRESRAALVEGLDRIVERSTLEYGEIRISRDFSIMDDEGGPTGSCTINVLVRTQEFDGMTMTATASSCANASDMVIEGVAALVR